MTNLCVAGDGGGEIATSTDPTGGTSAWSETPLGLEHVFCAFEHFCIAANFEKGTSVTSDPTTGGRLVRAR